MHRFAITNRVDRDYERGIITKKRLQFTRKNYFRRFALFFVNKKSMVYFSNRLRSAISGDDFTFGAFPSKCVAA